MLYNHVQSTTLGMRSRFLAQEVLSSQSGRSQNAILTQTSPDPANETQIFVQSFQPWVSPSHLPSACETKPFFFATLNMKQSTVGCSWPLPYFYILPTPTFHVFHHAAPAKKTATTRSSRSWISFSWPRKIPSTTNSAYLFGCFHGINHSNEALQSYSNYSNSKDFTGTFPELWFYHDSSSFQVFVMEFKSNL